MIDEKKLLEKLAKWEQGSRETAGLKEPALLRKLMEEVKSMAVNEEIKARIEREDLNGIAEASEKQRPKKPVEKHYEDDGEPPYVKYACPNGCGIQLHPTTGKNLAHEHAYCPKCGQKLDWGNAECEDLEEQGKLSRDDTRWIPVTERLPEPFRDVLAQWETRERFMNDRHVNFDVLWIDEKGNWESAMAIPSDKVVAWMPLPGPYREEG